MKKNKILRLITAAFSAFVLHCAHAQTIYTYTYTGSMQTYVVPSGVIAIGIDAWGGQGGPSTALGSVGGAGGRVTCTLAVTPNTTLNIFVGQKPGGLPGGYNGGGNATINAGAGGGATDIRLGGTALSNRILVAGGGGGGGQGNGGGGGGLTGAGGSTNGSGVFATGGSQSTGGTGGLYNNGSCAPGASAFNGSLGIGGNGVSGTGSACSPYGGSGGGGGYYGGGGMQINGAGGGSSYTGSSATNVTHTQGYNNADGGLTITELFFATSTQTNVSCNGGANGSATVSASGATAPYTYTWVPSGGSSSVATGLAAGTYTAYISSSSGGTIHAVVTITQPAVLTSSTSAQSDVSCNGGTNASATVSISGGTGPYTYSWLPSGGNASTASGLTANNYTLTITDSKSCTKAHTVSITQPATLTSVATQSNVSCNGGSNGSASVTVSGGTSPYTYTWSPSGGNASTASGFAAGNYTLTITDVNGCSRSQTVDITQPATLTSVATQSNVSCNGGSNGTANLSVSGGTSPYTYTWSPSGGNASTASGFAAGNYTVNITDAKGCASSQTVNITQPTILISSVATQSNVTCNSGSNGSASISTSGGIGPYTYIWAPSGGTTALASGLSAGNYSATITDLNGCIKTQTLVISEPSAINSTITTQFNVSCNGGTNGSATLSASGGTSPYTYSWSPSGGNALTVSGLASGSYTATIIDANTCVKIQTVVITEPTILVSSIASQTNVNCHGEANGSATLSTTGGTSPYTYSWSPSGGNAGTASGLIAATYTVGITDVNGCGKTQTITITEPVALTSSVSASDVSCNSGSNGSATITANGGTPPYTYTWSANGGSSAVTTSLVAGNYTATITDDKGCTTTQTTGIAEPSVLSTSVTSQSSVNCNGGSNGAAGISVSGGIAPYTYSWAPSGGAAASATAMTAGIYTASVTDVNGCVTAQTVAISQPAAISLTTSQTNVACNSLSNGSGTVVATGGVTPYTYTWTPSAGSNSTATGLSAGNYTVSIGDANGCSVMNTLTITEPNALNASVSLNGLVITASETGASYQWIDCDNSNQPVGGATAQSFTAVSDGRYAVIISLGECSVTSACQTIKTLGIKTSTPDAAIKLYPNPAVDKVTIKSSLELSSLTITDMAGRTIHSLTVSGSEVDVDLSEINNGVYYLKINYRGSTAVKALPLIINK